MLQRLFFYIVILSMCSGAVYAAENVLPLSVVTDNKACVHCHENQNSKLVNDWKNSQHAKTVPVVNCISCHGGDHKDIASKARRDQACTICHGGDKAAVVHSYKSSKHGTLMRLEEAQQDWTRPLSMANYRVPGCSYCHMHASNHDVSTTVRQDLMNDSVSVISSSDNVNGDTVEDKTRAVCQDCHSPRYITRLFSNGEAMLEIARMKIREANSLIEAVESEFTQDELAPARGLMLKMNQHLRNVYLGVGHHSPDYQWWHGHPALDGDLLRIKGNIAELRRTN